MRFSFCLIPNQIRQCKNPKTKTSQFIHHYKYEYFHSTKVQTAKTEGEVHFSSSLLDQSVFEGLHQLHDCFSHLNKDGNPPIASCRLTFELYVFFPQKSALIKARLGKCLRSLCRVQAAFRLPFSQAFVVHNRLPYMCYLHLNSAISRVGNIFSLFVLW